MFDTFRDKEAPARMVEEKCREISKNARILNFLGKNETKYIKVDNIS